MRETFDPAVLLGGEVQGQLDTSIPPIPEGEYPAVITKIEARSGEKDGKVWKAVDIFWNIDDATVREATGLPKPSAKQGMFLDLTPDGKLDMGKAKNTKLGQLRAAVGQNDPTKSWNFNMLVGQAAVVKIKQNPDKNDPTIVYSNVIAVRAM